MKTFLVRIVAVALLSCMLHAQNGIDVGRAKAFDNRALTIMIEKLNTQLAALQVVSQSPLTGALGTLQGFTSQEASTSLSVQAATPGNKVVPTGGDSTPASTFTVPSDVKYGLNAGDLLTDQVNLTYQIFNLQMILDRSVSDRVKHSDPRLQVVLGFDVTLDPPREAVDSVAVVEVTVKMKNSAEPVSVVALMPQEHTYNAAAISTKSSAFGGSAVTQLATVAYNSRKRTQTYFLYRDSDTIAFERSLGVRKGTDPGPDIHFGWQFRPVLGRRSVSPGSRQLFAVLALPATDRPSELCVQNLEIQVTTHWRKYDRSTLTSTEARQTPWWSMARYSLGLGIPSVYPPLGFGGGSPYELAVPTTAFVQQKLSPAVDHVSWSLVGSKQLLVSVAGKNFFNDTQVAVGGKVLTGSAFQIKSSQVLDLLVEPADPFSGVIMGRYGAAVPLVNPGPASPFEIDIYDVKPSVVIGGYASLNVFLTRKDGNDLRIADLPHSVGPSARLLEPIFTFNGPVIVGPWSYTDKPARDVKDQTGATNHIPAMVLANGSISADALKPGEGMFRVTYPFSDNGLRAAFPLNDPNKLIEARRLPNSILLFNKVSNAIPWNAWSAILPGNSVQKAEACPDPDSKLPASPPAFCFRDQYAFLTPPDKLDPGDTLILYESQNKGTYLVSVPAKPGATPPAPKPPPTINQNDSLWVPLDATTFTKPFTKAQIDGKDVTVNNPATDSTDPKAPPYAKVEVYVTRALSEKPGNLDVNFLDEKGALVSRARIVIACTNCQNTTDNKETKK